MEYLGFAGQQEAEVDGDDVYCVVGEDFVDDLLNFEIEEVEQIKEKAKEEEEGEDEENSNSSLTCSAVSFEPPPLSELALPDHDVAQLEWVSRIMDDSQSEFPTYEAHRNPNPKTGTQTLTRTEKPPVLPVKAKRSKRTRTQSSSWAPLYLNDSATSSETTATSSTSSCSSPSYSSQLIFAHLAFGEIPLPPLKKQKPKKRGRKPKQPGRESSGKGERCCSHCGVNKTPQWRTGPHGAKTLCNACGVRYKSGRLLPEYRPACSPTFVSHVHSNSHRKVLEMRRKKEEEDKRVFVSAAPPVASF